MWIIVETVEENEVTLCTVPESWEKSGILYWPPGNKGMNLRKDCKIIPNFERWSKQDCIVRRRDFTTFKAAMEAEKFLSNFDDTEDEENYLKKQTPTGVTRQKQNVHQVVDMNNLMRSPKSISNAPVITTKPNIKITRDPSSTMYAKTNDVPTILSCETANDIVSFPLIDDVTDNWQAKFEKIEAMLQLIYEEQKSSKKNIAELRVMLDKLVEMTIEQSRNSSNHSNQLQSTKHTFPSFQIIRCEEEINKLEADLGKEDFKTAFVQVMCEIGGTSGKKTGNKIAYMVMDRIFDRQFLTSCSWTGATKSKDVRKISFSKYKNIIHGMYDVIRAADSNFSISDLDNFLKKILRNSTSRNIRSKVPNADALDSIPSAQNGQNNDVDGYNV